MRALLIALMLMIGSQAGAGCPDLCDIDWWKTATAADGQAETLAQQYYLGVISTQSLAQTMHATAAQCEHRHVRIIYFKSKRAHFTV